MNSLKILRAMIILGILFLFGNCFLSAQHSPFYSQYMYNGLALSPAYTGARDVMSINTAFPVSVGGI